MRIIPARWLALASAMVVALALIAGSALVSPAHAGTNGTLKLKVQRCSDSTWIARAAVEVRIYRPGVGNVDTGSGTTDDYGYVAISFSDLEDGDEAHVTVTPSGEFPDDHTYYWVDPPDKVPGLFDIGGFGDAPCDDGWYDQSNNVILCNYN